ncbi:photosystem reaction center subunit H [Methylobacterium dankookense]|uniref:Photosystem reaction center subunit H n=1 Tax=Methylobacterium dankookense TaxID=560405 RepID=A0A564FWS2_9HYPH|nr:photosystem reaction center subunit H [Methylobacterium dankookense]GJD59180.1 hypothetical protein IFDJLNFL_5107 [Methylobacterium dankookense]VUF12447.1 hypothetical protein MTDSW087_02139 [Methylobacterium dankookense]
MIRSARSFLVLPLALPAALAACLAGGSAQACDVAGAKIEDLIAGKAELREGANGQTLRDLRTLRDAAIVLESYKYGPECERLLAIVKTLAADPDKAIEQSGDTDEDKAESIAESRKPRIPKGDKTEPAEAKPR